MSKIAKSFTQMTSRFKGLVAGFGPKGMPGRMRDSMH